MSIVLKGYRHAKPYAGDGCAIRGESRPRVDIKDNCFVDDREYKVVVHIDRFELLPVPQERLTGSVS